jgi:hypothetical protein
MKAVIRVDESDRALRNATYQLFVKLGRAPTSAEVSRAVGAEPTAVADGWRRLHGEHALVLNDGTDELRMANPFAAQPTAYRVHADSRWWYANCAWDAIGICAALHVDGRIEASCPDCAEPVTTEIIRRQPSREDLLFHCLVPARSWWDNIGFT